MKFKIAALSLMVLSQPAFAADACMSEALQNLRKVVAQSLSSQGTPVTLTPAIAYENRTGNQISNGPVIQRQQAFAMNTANELYGALSMYAAGNDPSQIAKTLLGDVNQRQILQILRRPSGPNQKPVNEKCKGSCEDTAIHIRQLYTVNSSAQKVVDRMSVFKFESASMNDVFFCPVGAGCASRNDLLAANSQVMKSKTPSPMDGSKPYLVRELNTASPSGSIETTSLYRSKALNKCGNAYLVSGVQIQGQNSFDDASTYVVIAEQNGRSLVYGLMQARATYARGTISKVFGGGLFGGIAVRALADVYNDQGVRMQANERVNSSGVLK